MFYQFFWLFLISGPLIQTKKIKLYTCDDEKERNEVSNLHQKLSRLIRLNDKIYFVFNSRIIFTKLFSVDAKQQQFDNLTNFVTYNFYQLESDEVYLNQLDDIPKKSQIIGYLNDLTDNYPFHYNETYEFYSKSILNAKKNFSDQIWKKAYELDFKKSPAARKETIEIQYIDAPLGYLNFYELIKRVDLPAGSACQMIQFFQIEVSKYTALLAINKLIDYQPVVDYHFLEFEKSPKFFSDYVEHKFFLAYLYLYPINNSDIYSNSVIYLGISPDYTIYFKHFVKNWLRSEKIHNFHQDEAFYSTSLSFAELFSCRGKIRNENQLKGIYFDSKSYYTFIFIDRYYVRIHDRFMRNFHITNEQYDEAKEFEFESEKISSNMKYVILNRKWIYSIGYAFYFWPSDEFFKLNFQEPDLLIEKMHSRPFERCYQQTFFLDQSLYCFEKSDYYAIYPNRILIGKIKSIFEKVTDFWHDDLQLISIQPYKDGQVLFITITDLFRFEYNLFKVQNDKTLIYEPSVMPEKFPNCLFQNCDHSHMYYFNGAETNSDKTKLPFGAKIIYWTFALVLILVVLIFSFVVRGKTKFTEIRSLNQSGSILSTSTLKREVTAQKEVSPEKEVSLKKKSKSLSTSTINQKIEFNELKQESVDRTLKKPSSSSGHFKKSKNEDV